MSESKSLNHNPLGETDTILREEYYGTAKRAEPPLKAKKRTAKAKPDHYKVICISMYMPDIDNLNTMVSELKDRGYTKANKSQLIRYALRQLDIDKLPPPNQ